MSEISPKLFEAMNDQIQKELASAYIYLAMSAKAETMNFKGAAQWLRLQWEEEIAHAMKLMDYINDRGNAVVLKAIEQPTAEYTSLLDIFENVLVHEQKVTASINDLYGLAMEERDFAAQAFLQWYISEQVEEESNATEIIETLKLAGDESSVLLMIDKELGARQPQAETSGQ